MLKLFSGTTTRMAQELLSLPLTGLKSVSFLSADRRNVFNVYSHPQEWAVSGRRPIVQGNTIHHSEGGVCGQRSRSDSHRVITCAILGCTAVSE